MLYWRKKFGQFKTNFIFATHLKGVPDSVIYEEG